jgi:hypothetical protein
MCAGRKEARAVGEGLPEVTPTLGIKLASLAVHAQEMAGPGGHAFDRVAIDGLLADPEVQQYLAALDKLALLPRARDHA